MEWLALGMLGIAGIAGSLWLFSHFFLKTEDLSHHDESKDFHVYPRPQPSQGHSAAVNRMARLKAKVDSHSHPDRLHVMRREMDNLGLGKEGDCEIIPASADGVPGEWVVARGADVKQRVLYLHGGAFMMGSPRSHRAITCEFARRLKAVVFVPDYRLMPEHKRLDCFSDCQIAYHWILENGPEGKTDLDKLVIAGDSAGGCLTLTTVAWARDENFRQADAAVVFSPVTDLSFSGKTMATNADSDLLLNPLMGRIHKLPRILVLWSVWLTSKIRPNNPLISPLMGDLSGLPPTLIQASDSEMLLSDGIRYVNKANAQGGNVQLQIWPHMLHVWHIFSPDLAEADEAFTEITHFIDEVRKS